MENGRGGARPGAGQPTKYGGPTRTTRVPVHLSSEKIAALMELEALLDYWEDELTAHPPDRQTNARYWHAARMLGEIRALGF